MSGLVLFLFASLLSELWLLMATVKQHLLGKFAHQIYRLLFMRDAVD